MQKLPTVAKCRVCGQTNVSIAHVLGHGHNGKTVPKTRQPARWLPLQMLKRYNGKPAVHATVSVMKPSQKQLELLAVLSDQPMGLKEIAERLDHPLKKIASTLRARLYDLESMKLVIGYRKSDRRRSQMTWKKV